MYTGVFLGHNVHWSVSGTLECFWDTMYTAVFLGQNVHWGVSGTLCTLECFWDTMYTGVKAVLLFGKPCILGYKKTIVAVQGALSNLSELNKSKSIGCFIYTLYTPLHSIYLHVSIYLSIVLIKKLPLGI